VNYVDIDSAEYPYLLKQIKDPPVKLYFKGNWDVDVFEEMLSVVGSRKMTGYGEMITESLVSEIAGNGITIVSGFMYGIDAQAHKAALMGGGRTIAVMACGIERINPEYQAELYSGILNNGGLAISEYPGDTPPLKWTYPRRNRIIAGLSPVLLVVEAGMKSGALITAGIARRYNKKIFAVPGPLTSSVSRGTALLIKQGASLVTGPQDLLLEYGRTKIGRLFSGKDLQELHSEQKKIIDLLSLGPLGIDEIARLSGKPVSEIGADITALSLKKYLVPKDGKYYLLQGGCNVD
jgi:DNA processing protein